MASEKDLPGCNRNFYLKAETCYSTEMKQD